MGRALDDIALRVWISLVQLGGYWKARELRDQKFPLLEPCDLRTRLDCLVENGMAREIPGLTRATDRYGVTTACQAPPGYEHLMVFQGGGS